MLNEIISLQDKIAGFENSIRITCAERDKGKFHPASRRYATTLIIKRAQTIQMLGGNLALARIAGLYKDDTLEDKVLGDVIDSSYQLDRSGFHDMRQQQLETAINGFSFVATVVPEQFFNGFGLNAWLSESLYELSAIDNKSARKQLMLFDQMATRFTAKREDKYKLQDWMEDAHLSLSMQSSRPRTQQRAHRRRLVRLHEAYAL